MAVRFYLPQYKYNPDREAVVEDLGNYLTTAGIVLQGMGSTIILMSPNTEFPLPQVGSLFPMEFFDEEGNVVTKIVQPSLEEWGEIIRRTDDPEIFIGEAGGINKALHRKQRFAISGETQQRVWARDNFKCQYCGIQMGKALMTIDHWIPLELGGVNDESNYLTACRRDNKNKGSLMPEEFCKKFKFDFARLQAYVDSLK
jgi:hypothetical protein